MVFHGINACSMARCIQTIWQRKATIFTEFKDKLRHPFWVVTCKFSQSSNWRSARSFPATADIEMGKFNFQEWQNEKWNRGTEEEEKKSWRTTWRRLEFNANTECDRFAFRRCRVIEVNLSDKRFAMRISCNSLVSASSAQKSPQLNRNKITLHINWCAIGCAVLYRIALDIGQTDAPWNRHSLLSTVTQWQFIFQPNARVPHTHVYRMAPAQIRIQVENSLPLSTSTRASFRLRVSKTTACIHFFYCCYGWRCCCRCRQVLFNFGLLTSFIKFHREKREWKFPHSFYCCEILRQNWEMRNISVHGCNESEYVCARQSTNRTDAEAERDKSQRKCTAPAQLDRMLNGEDRGNEKWTQWESTKCSLMQKFFWCQYGAATPKTMTKKGKNCNCDFNVAHQMNGTHGRRKYFQMEKLQHSIHSQTCRSASARRVCDSLATRIERKMHLRGSEAARQGAANSENEINIRFPLSLSQSVPLLSFIFFYWFSLQQQLVTTAVMPYNAHTIACSHDENTKSTHSCSRSVCLRVCVCVRCKLFRNTGHGARNTE